MMRMYWANFRQESRYRETVSDLKSRNCLLLIKFFSRTPRIAAHTGTVVLACLTDVSHKKKCRKKLLSDVLILMSRVSPALKRVMSTEADEKISDTKTTNKQTINDAAAANALSLPPSARFMVSFHSACKYDKANGGSPRRIADQSFCQLGTHETM